MKQVCFGCLFITQDTLKEDYLDMPEWKLDIILSDYDYLDKRDFAIGAFLWISTHNAKLYQDKSSPPD
ncbi:unnamed protein product [Brassica rapa]|uniref:DUF7722 domain-containing protein n=1 Tax=Brassica campestris TaxID=3711 RepID=A0A3P5YS24_BRACM|nr:unnamed protein product [Brassica rapa]VDC62698.1 unnamed protein product [Brassica rapa]